MRAPGLVPPEPRGAAAAPRLARGRTVTAAPPARATRILRHGDALGHYRARTGSLPCQNWVITVPEPGHSRARTGSFLCQNWIIPVPEPGHSCASTGLFLCQKWVILVPVQGHSRASTGSFPCQYRVIPVPVPGHSRARTGSFPCQNRAIPVPVLGHYHARNGPFPCQNRVIPVPETGHSCASTGPLPCPSRTPLKSARAPGLAKALSLLRGDGRTLLFAGIVFLVGAAGSAGHNFLLWQLQDQGSGELLMGLWVGLGPLAELALDPLRAQLPRALPGCGLELLSLAVLSYSLLRAPWAALPVQALSGLSGGALRWRLQGTVGDTATPGTERALHALLGGLCAGGAGLGSLAGGFVVQNFGLAALFQASCVGLGLWILFVRIVRSRLPRQRKINYSRLLAADSSEVSDSEEENEKDWLVKAMKDESCNRNWIQQHGIK